MKTRLLIVDDQALIRNGIISIIREHYPDWEFHEAADGLDAFRKAHKVGPDLVLMDHVMPKLTGIESATMILQKFQGTKIIMVYAELTDEDIMKAMAAGVQGFVPKNFSAPELLQAIKQVLKGNHFMSGRIFDLARLQSDTKTWGKNSPQSFFSPRETEVLQLILQGNTSKRIAELLHISKRTVDRHRSNLLYRCGARSPLELLKFALFSSR